MRGLLQGSLHAQEASLDPRHTAPLLVLRQKGNWGDVQGAGSQDQGRKSERKIKYSYC